MSPRAQRYAPYYCEENVWHLLGDAGLVAAEAVAVVVTNPERRVALWHQRAATTAGGPVLWDYHVIAIARAPAGGHQVWDLDTTLSFPCAAAHYVAATFRRHALAVAPRFRVVGAPEYRRRFGSDRRHMRARGAWLQPPPPWPPIGATHELPALLAHDDPSFGPWIDLSQLRARYCDSP